MVSINLTFVLGLVIYLTSVLIKIIRMITLPIIVARFSPVLLPSIIIIIVVVIVSVALIKITLHPVLIVDAVAVIVLVIFTIDVIIVVII